MTEFVFEFTSAGEKSFLALPKTVRERIEKKLRFFLTTKNPLDFALKIEGTNNKYRFRVGDYRVLIAKRKSRKLVLLLILKVGHRKEVYKKV